MQEKGAYRYYSSQKYLLLKSRSFSPSVAESEPLLRGRLRLLMYEYSKTEHIIEKNFSNIEIKSTFFLINIFIYLIYISIPLGDKLSKKLS